MAGASKRTREIRYEARMSVVALIDVNIDAGDGDLFVVCEDEGYAEQERMEFVQELRRIQDRIRPTSKEDR